MERGLLVVAGHLQLVGLAEELGGGLTKLGFGHKGRDGGNEEIL
jgi:hypothetical protein